VRHISSFFNKSPVRVVIQLNSTSSLVASSEDFPSHFVRLSTVGSLETRITDLLMQSRLHCCLPAGHRVVFQSCDIGIKLVYDCRAHLLSSSVEYASATQTVKKVRFVGDESFDIARENTRSLVGSRIRRIGYNSMSRISVPTLIMPLHIY
jgi:hypothetical protein